MSTESSRSPDSRLGPSTSQNAALQGASLAFAKPAVKPKPQINTYSGRDGAVAAAAKAGSGSPPKNAGRSHKSRDQQAVQHQITGERGTSGRGYDLESGNQSLNQSKSASFIAASLAASRSVTPNHTGQLQSPQGQRQNTAPRYPIASPESFSLRETSNHDLDITSIPPTTSLIDRFEQKGVTSTNLPKGGSELKRSSTSAAQKSPRPLEPQKSPLLVARRTGSPATTMPRKQKPAIKAPKPISPVAFSGGLKPIDTPKSVPVSRTASALSQKQVKPTASPRPPSIASKPPAISPAPALPSPKPRNTPTPATKPIPIPSKLEIQRTGDSYASSDDSFVSASDVQPSLPPRRNTGISNRHLSSPSPMAVDSLANAIVASSLASSRAASPSKPSSFTTPPLPPPRRNTRGRIFRNQNDSSRTPSPAKGSQLRTTMRKPKQDDPVDSDRYRRRRNLMKKHPHKHHEGDRKRWRDELTERERKRYEAVWASNKGLYTSASFDGGSEVCNLVVRDIWNRSRLPAEVLEEVYALVDRKGQGALGKEEFVVGLWLVDQRLRGRKLPIRVTDSVWRSVGILGGIKVKKPGS